MLGMSEGEQTRDHGSGADGGGVAGAGLERIACQMPGIPGGCPHVIEQYAGTGGRKPKYCGQTVDGVPHTRYTALRVREGKLTLPAPGSGPDHEPAPVRPVSYARASIEALGGELRDQLAAHQTWAADFAARLDQQLATATDPDAAAAEITAAHRDARTRIDAAEAARDDAATRARAAETATRAATTAQAEAEAAAETALAEADDAAAEAEHARAERDQARQQHDQVLADRDQLQQQLEATRTRLVEAEHTRDEVETARARLAEDLEQTRTELEQLRAAHEQITAERDQARTELAAARDQAESQQRRAATAEHDRDTATAAREELRAERDQARERAEQAAREAGEARTAQAVAEAQNEALTRQLAHDIATERAHAQQRLDDQAARYDQQIIELRTQLATGPPEPARGEAAPVTPRRRRASRSGGRSPEGTDTTQKPPEQPQE
ncbi:hypothetical protein SAMN05216207_104015 [Pseudonocardia ammonioxydans]|uniref:Uncharacterized protein n=2 Tax=Pseudonocardia ammonioxydans TaxID=260086 RepID=A0A1I5FRA8_PSUAM|nr:hypothetical protein SAMN05216207_104015 [Pseudonocardia ammonioxydans]